MPNFKSNITHQIPIYLDGSFEVFTIKQTTDHFPIEFLKKENKEIWFEELSISDKLRFDSEQRERELSIKLRIPQTKELTSLNVLKVGNDFHKIFNVYHFKNKEGYGQSDLTLENYPNPKLEGQL